MKSKLLSFLVLASLLLVLTNPGFVFAQDGQSPITPSPSPTPPEPPIPLPDDIMPPIGRDFAFGSGVTETDATNYSVLPIMFVPSDLTPNPLGLRYIDQRMQLIQRWYAEQLRGKTFTLQPAIVVRGSQPLSFYYGNCYPPDNCGAGYNMWDSVFTDLSTQGYPYQSNLIRGVFFQHNGMGAPALGGGGAFLVALDADGNRMNAETALNQAVRPVWRKVGPPMNWVMPLVCLTQWMIRKDRQGCLL